MNSRKGFTLIELLAVIIILGILMLIAIPSVTSYINNSRKSAYYDTIQEISKGAMIKVNEGGVSILNTDATFYLPYTCVKTENGEAKSPYGKFEEAYVAITFDGDGYDYYFVGRDSKNMGVLELTNVGTMTKDNIVANVTSINTGVGIEGKTKVIMIDEDCKTKSEPVDATSFALGTGTTGGSGGSGGSGGCAKDKTWEFEYTGAVEEFDANCNGKYKLEVWGAEGGKGADSPSGTPSLSGTPGKGGYSVGTITVSSSTKMYVYVGGKGSDCTSTGGGTAGFNGGGNGKGGSGGSFISRTGGGGGASDIRIGEDSLYARVIVAGGGGSTGWNSSLTGGAGGGTSGTSGSSSGSCTGGGGGGSW